ncbi:MAG: hypothetical protein GY795_50920 [Desulfobacterales bacterium]|nr:hypothetical protein [Desulfobacterales bacterium]
MKKTVFLLFTLCFGLFPYAHAFNMNQIQIHGFISQGYLKSNDYDFWNTSSKEGTFQFNEMGINFIAEPLDNFRLGIQLMSRDLGDAGNNKVIIDWAYGDYRFRNWLGIKAGLMKRPYGLYNQSRDIDAARTEILLPTSIYPESERAFYLGTQGIAVYGILPHGLSYEFQYGIVPLDMDEGFVKRNERMMETTAQDVHNDYVFSYSLKWETPLEGLSLGFSGFNLGDVELETPKGKMVTTQFDTYVGSIQYIYDDFSFSAEYKIEKESSEMRGLKLLDGKELEACYAKTSYRFAEWFEIGIGYSVLYPDKNDKDGASFEEMGIPAVYGWNKDLSVSTRFDISDYWILKLEGHYMNGLVGTTNHPSEMGPDPSEDWFLFAAKTTFSF